MPIDLDAKLVESATNQNITYNEYGDRVFGTPSAASPCLYRDISSLSHSANRDDVLLDGLLWFSGSEDVERGDVYYHSSEGYLLIEKVIKAKRLLADDTQQFIKCEVVKIRQIS